MDPVADPSPSRRSLKRRPPARSPELSPKAGPGAREAAAAEELIRRVEELEAAAARLRGEKEAAEDAARGLRQELDAERASAETAASEAMLMIERLQREKAAAQMEARQFKRYAEGREDREREVQDELASLSDLAASYHSRLQSHGIDPDSFTDEDDEESYEEVGAEDVEQIHMAALEVKPNARESTNGMVKTMVVGNDGEEEVEDAEEEPSSPVEKEFEYTVDVTCASTTKPATSVVAEYVGDGNSGGLYARVEALEADRVALRREISVLRAERAQLVMAREMARRLCWEMVAEQRAIVKKAVVPASSFSVLGICKGAKLGTFGVFSHIAMIDLVERFSCDFLRSEGPTINVDVPECCKWFAVGAINTVLEKRKVYSQVYLWSVDYVPWPPAASRQIHVVESLAASAKATKMTKAFSIPAGSSQMLVNP
ncbi:Myosin-binding protein 7 [Zea mays]|uniref:Myosin-binding protein 7 n=1 Tax=Zea mays TaxID=4577 RepID=A0A1D6GFW8_MAIZE|nr:Myosin-binding protein 7 [Zea mays]